VKSESQSLCFTCGQETGDPPRLNRLENGLPCPTCRDRILAYLPAPLPGPGSAEYQRTRSTPRVEVEKTPLGTFGALYSAEFGDPDEPA